MRFTATIDKNEKEQPMKNQRFGSSIFFAITGRWIKETYLFKPSIEYRSTIFNPVITQLNQIILPPFKLPYFEKIGDDKKLCNEVLTDLIFLQDKCEDVDFINDNRRVQYFSNIV